MQIQIQSQNAAIGIQSNDGYYSIEQNQWPLSLRVREPELTVRREDAVLLIDQRRCFAEAGLKGIQEINRIYAAKGRRAALEGTFRIAQEGKELADIHKGNALIAQAKRKTWRKTKPVVYDMIPKSRSEITVIPKEVTGSFRKGSIEANMGKIKPDIRYSQGRLDVYLRQKQQIQINFIGNQVDTYVG